MIDMHIPLRRKRLWYHNRTPHAKAKLKQIHGIMTAGGHDMDLYAYTHYGAHVPLARAEKIDVDTMNVEQIHDIIYMKREGFRMTTFEKLGLQAVIFDMDGLLFETESLYINAWPEVGQAMGFPITKAVAAQSASLNYGACEILFQSHYGPTFSLAKALPIMRELLTVEIKANGIPLRPFARETVELVHEKGIPLALGTSNLSDVAHRYLEVTQLSDYFRTVVASDMVAHAKPAPDIFLLAAERMGVASEQCVVLEDSPVGIQAAYAAGCLPVMVPDLIQPDEATRAKAWRVFGNLAQAAEVLF